MSLPGVPDPARDGATQSAAIDFIIIPRVTDLGGIKVRRALPAKETQMVGPFIFFDEFGPGEFITGKGLDVRPHPHIGLSTVTYLFDGAITHRDSLGSHQDIRPGELNLMKAGRAIVHSERTPQSERDAGAKLYGIQLWMALPKEHEESEPEFLHHPAQDQPVVSDSGAKVTVVMGALYGTRAKVKTLSDCFYADAALATGAILPLDADFEERAIYVSSGAVEVDNQRYDAGRMIIARPGVPLTITALDDSRLLLLGGAPMDGPRYLWWNFVSSRREAMMQAAEDWEQGRMPVVPGDEEEFIPLDGARPKLKDKG